MSIATEYLPASEVASVEAATNLEFSFSDTIAGYVRSFDRLARCFTLETSDGREYEVYLTPTTFGRITQNLGEGYIDATGRFGEMITEGQFLYAYGVFYFDGGAKHKFEAKSIVFPGNDPEHYRQEEPDWWTNQIRSISNSYLKWQFNYPEQKIDYRNYRTVLHLEGAKRGDFLQETDTISRLVYGFASAFLLTGEDAFLEAAEEGTEYLRDHMRFFDPDENLIYWYHGIQVSGNREQKLLTSEFGDDYDSLPMYEQIYALAGPTQTFRATGDRKILSDIENTVELFDRFYKDHVGGGYFSHIDPITLDPRAESLGPNRARKNWNSVGDHAPAYLINLFLATGEEKYADFLVDTADTIARHFPDFENSPFVQERFHEDWSHDQSWGWQQNRAVVGHNLKIAWNLMRIHHARPSQSYEELARKIGDVMPEAGSDRQRGGWYDVVERALEPGQRVHRYVWHDRKAWWQQEQAILAYLILHGALGEEVYEKHAREAAAYYNAFFLDHEDGGVYFNTLANGLPYLLGNERFKGSHSMSGYHSMELCYLAAVYTNLLITKQPLDLFFKPYPNGFKDNLLRVSPDLLPPGSIRIGAVEIDGQPYEDYDADQLIVRLPESEQRVKVKVTVVPNEKKA
ncbi:AGE family epimerase/isomerase [Candidatus Laterigemmans baculatus]|uniref:AGE family epimerase/isomerase n=1 Tax=Candidatus Laterigemmans baculatus TaxID=2770505 RepID=UPI0013DB39B6|nr:AGE family epimerase/isomerase [Candidatus Laterigemmans baculatus]